MDGLYSFLRRPAFQPRAAPGSQPTFDSNEILDSYESTETVAPRMTHRAPVGKGCTNFSFTSRNNDSRLVQQWRCFFHRLFYTAVQDSEPHFSLIRPIIVPPSLCSSCPPAGATSSITASSADSPPKASAFAFIVRNMLMKPLLRLWQEEHRVG